MNVIFLFIECNNNFLSATTIYSCNIMIYSCYNCYITFIARVTTYQYKNIKLWRDSTVQTIYGM